MSMYRFLFEDEYGDTYVETAIAASRDDALTIILDRHDTAGISARLIKSTRVTA